jgi:hypothetical protein
MGPMLNGGSDFLDTRKIFWPKTPGAATPERGESLLPVMQKRGKP